MIMFRKLSCILLLILVGCIPTTQVVTVEGVVTSVSPLWTSNGDGSIAIQIGEGTESIPIHIVGVCNPEPQTQMILRVKYTQELVNHRVRVRGVYKDKTLIARSVQEL
jgi:hypothetical protein